jgi:hypothetical protein
LIAVFRHAPINEGIPYSVLEDTIHSFFASVVGFSFTAFAISAAFIEKTSGKRIFALLIGFLATGLSILMFSVTSFTGLWQRLLFMITFAWLVFFFEGQRIKKAKSEYQERGL